VCGRYTLRHTTDQIALRFAAEPSPALRSIVVGEIGTESLAPLSPRYNIAPTQPILAIRQSGFAGERSLDLLRWGLVPFWAKDAGIGSKLINARAETLTEKPAFRSALGRRRCLIPADGFYEWKQTDDHKQPMYIRRKDGELFAFAGLWAAWEAPDGSELESCTIITVPPNALMEDIHDRMPAILRPEQEAVWLATSVPVAEAMGVLKPAPDQELEAYPVSLLVNRPGVETEACIEPLAQEG